MKTIKKSLLLLSCNLLLYNFVSAGTPFSRTKYACDEQKNEQQAVELCGVDESLEGKAIPLDDVWSPDEEIETRANFLHAAQCGDLSVLEEALKAGIEVNYQDSHGMTALHWSARNGQLRVVKRLLKENKTKIDLICGCGSSALQLAIEYNHQACINVLRRAGAHLQGIDSDSECDCCCDLGDDLCCVMLWCDSPRSNSQ